MDNWNDNQKGSEETVSEPLTDKEAPFPSAEGAQSAPPSQPEDSAFSGTAGQQAPQQPYGEPVRYAISSDAQNAYTGYNYAHVRSPYDDDAPQPPRRKKRVGMVVFVIVLCFFILLFAGGIALFSLLRSDLGAALGIAPATTTTQTSENPIKPPDQGTMLSTTAASAKGFVPVENAPSIDIQQAPPRTTAAPVYDANGMRVLTINEIYKKAVSSVVGVVTTLDSAYGGKNLGSGVIMSEDGFILTNAHVVENGASFVVVLDDKTEYDAVLIAADKKSDIAIVKIEATDLPAAEFGDSDALEVGDLAVAIGNPSSLDLAGTTTAGIISAVNREIVVDNNGNKLKLIQTDAAINPGNSGGPLLNCYGQVIGISTVKLNSSTYEGLCFAIPTTVFKPIVDELLQYGQVAGYPAIGITGEAIDRYRSQVYKIPMGVYVATVSESSDAFAKGIQPGDIITGVNGQEVYTVSDINLIKNDYHVGDSITLTIYRNGETMDFEIRLVDDVDLK